MTLISNNTIDCSCLSIFDKSVITLFRDNTLFNVVVEWKGQLSNKTCDDIAHYYGDNGKCISLSCSKLSSGNLMKPGFKCSHTDGYLAVTHGCWYDNGLCHYVISCPADYCNFSHWAYKILPGPFLDQDI